MFGVICSEHVDLDSVRMISIDQRARTTYWFCVKNNFFEWRRLVMKCLHLVLQIVEEAIYAAIDRGDRQGSFGVKSIPPTNHVVPLKADCSTTQCDVVTQNLHSHRTVFGPQSFQRRSASIPSGSDGAFDESVRRSATKDWA